MRGLHLERNTALPAHYMRAVIPESYLPSAYTPCNLDFAKCISDYVSLVLKSKRPPMGKISPLMWLYKHLTPKPE
jgi:hypothetical protein